ARPGLVLSADTGEVDKLGVADAGHRYGLGEDALGPFAVVELLDDDLAVLRSSGGAKKREDEQRNEARQQAHGISPRHEASSFQSSASRATRHRGWAPSTGFRHAISADQPAGLRRALVPAKDASRGRDVHRFASAPRPRSIPATRRAPN